MKAVLGLVLLGLVALGAWWALQNRRAPDERNAVSGDVPPAAHAEGTHQPRVPITAGTDWDDVDNPSRDGWGSEAFTDNAHKQLKRLGKLLSHAPVTPDALAPLLSDSFSFGPLVPQSLDVVYQDKALRVERGAAPEGTTPGAAALADALSALADAMPSGVVDRSKMKIFNVAPGVDDVTTRLYVTFIGRDESGGLEQNATWRVRWSSHQSKTPLIARIDVEAFEQVVSSGGTLFSDRTASVLENAPAYTNQLAHGLNYWARRMESFLDPQFGGPIGLAVGDVNGDGLDDVYLCQDAGLPNRLFLQNPDGTVRDASRAMGVDWLDESHSAVIADLDNDGDQDLAVVLLHGVLIATQEDGQRFAIRELINARAQLMSINAVDYDGDALLDLFVSGYYPRQTEENMTRTAMVDMRHFVYHDANSGGANIMLRNVSPSADTLAFADVTDEVGLNQNNRRFSYANLWEDFDNDGDPDLYVANDYGRNNLYLNDGGFFRDVAQRVGAEDSAAGMGVTAGDFDRDGDIDIYISNMYSFAGNRIAFQKTFKPGSSEETRSRIQRFAKGNTLLENQGDGTFRDISTPMALTMGRWGWGVLFTDINNDGWEDLLACNGYITGTGPGDL